MPMLCTPAAPGHDEHHPCRQGAFITHNGTYQIMLEMDVERVAPRILLRKHIPYDHTYDISGVSRFYV